MLERQWFHHVSVSLMGKQDLSGFFEVPAAWLLKGVASSLGFSRVKIHLRK